MIGNYYFCTEVDVLVLDFTRKTVAANGSVFPL